MVILGALLAYVAYVMLLKRKATPLLVQGDTELKESSKSKKGLYTDKI